MSNYFEDDMDLDENLRSFFSTSPNIKKAQPQSSLPPRKPIKKLNYTDYQNNNTNLVKDIIEKMNELIIKIELIDAKCDGQTLIIRKLETKLKDLENSILL